MRRAFTLIEALVVLMILATFFGLLVPALMAAKANADRVHEKTNADRVSEDAEKSWYLRNINHDGHLWVITHGLTSFVHHPDCPCHGKAERDDQGR